MKLIFSTILHEKNDGAIKKFEADLRHNLVLNDLEVSEWTVLTNIKNEKPGFESFHYEVECTIGNLNYKSLRYYKFCCSWSSKRESFTHFLPIARPWLTIYDDQYFFEGRRLTHEMVPVKGFSLGTLAWPSKWYFVFNQDGFASDGSTRKSIMLASFYHDLKYLALKTSINSNEKYQIKYSGISKVLLEQVKTDLNLYLIINHPLAIYRDHLKDKKGEFVETRFPCPLAMNRIVFGKSNVLMLCLPDITLAYEIVSRLHFRCGKIPIHYVCMEKEPFPALNIVPTNAYLSDFSSLYLLEGILKRNFVFELQAISNGRMFKSFKEFELRNVGSLRKVLMDMLYMIDRGIVVHYAKLAELLFKWHSTNEVDDNFIVPERMQFIRRVVITPTRMLYWPPEITFDNRVLRNFEPEFALRVSFRDDNLVTLNLQSAMSHSTIFEEAISHPLTNGLKIGQRMYRLLGWSNSQLREHGVWMYSTDKGGNDVRGIQSWMGDFSGIHSVSKYMARMGQCFSHTEHAITIPFDPSHVETQKDITCDSFVAGNKIKYCFSDGVGRISKSASQKVCEAQNLKHMPSAFQIRYAGYKGMLLLDPTLTGKDIIFRDSMKKFNCPNSDALEIVKTSAPVPAFLNKPLITILSQLNVSNGAFLKMQEDMLLELTDMLIFEAKASQYLTQHNSFSLDLGKLADSGVSLTTEPFFRAMILAHHRHAVEKLRGRGRLKIDTSQGRTMFGVMDETKNLQYGQIFVQYSKELRHSPKYNPKETIILQGPAVVTKNPCVQAGDVRILEAVDVPELHHVVDCLVFPQNGERPHSNEMGGSDLDGDEYCVIWKKDLIFKGGNRSAGHFPSAREWTVKGRIEDKHKIEWLCKYIRNDQLGTIGNAHLAHADFQTEGIFSPICENIAKKYSFAVDFAKSGQFVHLEKGEQPLSYPDFMEKSGTSRIYPSTRILGDIYRACKDFERINESASQGYTDVQVDESLLYPGWENFKSSAELTYRRYRKHILAVMSMYGIEHEIEMITGAFTKLHTHMQQRQEWGNAYQIVMRSVQQLLKNFRQEFWNEFETTETSKDSCRKASAWYEAAYRNLETPPILSLPWVVGDQLALGKKAMKEMNPIAIKSEPFLKKMSAMLGDESILSQIQPASFDADLFCRCMNLSIEQQTAVTLSLRLLLQWGVKERIFSDKNIANHDDHPFLKFFFTVVKKAIEDDLVEKDNANLTVLIVLYFLRQSITLRFLSKEETEEIYPNNGLSTKHLGKKAMAAYHSIAVTGNYEEFGIKGIGQVDGIVVEMEPVRIPIDLVLQSAGTGFLTEEGILKRLSGVGYVNIRVSPEAKCAYVTASGSLTSVRFLEDALRQDANSVRKIFLKKSQ